MDEVIRQIVAWQAAGEKVAVATVIRVEGSAPRPVGARLATISSGAFAGSVSGGCVEGAVVREAARVLRAGKPHVAHYGISNEVGWEVGLACGGGIDVLVHVAQPEVWQRLAEVTGRGEACVLMTVVAGDYVGAQAVVTAGEEWVEFPREDGLTMAKGVLEARTSGPRLVHDEVLVEPFVGPPQLVIVGGVHTAIPLTRLAGVVGFQVTVIDPRSSFASGERFPDADRVLVAWPAEAMSALGVDNRTAIVILTHDPKIDEPAILSALASDAFYIGAIGSRKTQAARRERLEESGIAVEALDRIFGPIGLDIGGESPEEMAAGILAEIIAVRNGCSGGFLSGKLAG